jgi:hypothetical protein
MTIQGEKQMTKEEFKQKFIESGLLTWDDIRDIDFDHMYNHLHFIDSTVAEMFGLPIETIIKKRKQLGICAKRDDYGTFVIYKQQGYLKWDEINYNRFDYLYNKCGFADSTIAELFGISKKMVTTKRKELGIFMFDNWVPRDDRNDVSSYLDFIYMESLH